MSVLALSRNDTNTTMPTFSVVGEQQIWPGPAAYSGLVVLPTAPVPAITNQHFRLLFPFRSLGRIDCAATRSSTFLFFSHLFLVPFISSTQVADGDYILFEGTNDFDINLTSHASLASTNAINTVPCRVAHTTVLAASC